MLLQYEFFLENLIILITECLIIAIGHIIEMKKKMNPIYQIIIILNI